MHEITSGFEFMMRGGFMMVPLAIAALAGLTIIFERVYALVRRFKTPEGFVATVLRQVGSGELETAAVACRAKDLPAASVLLAGIEHFANPLEEMELAMKNRAEEWIPRLEKRVEVIDTVITAAPLMGLLGTITGMMASFRVLTEKGVNEPNAITGGVAEALIATATGLVIALVCLVAYNFLNARVRRMIYELEQAGSRLVELRRSVQRGQGRK